MTLSARLRTATHDAHRRAEQSGVMRRILRGDIDRATYIALLTNLRALYAELESGLARHATHPAIAPIAWSELYRLPSLDQDLAYWGGANGAPLTPSARVYADRLRKLAATDPVLLVAHGYVRYLGDLSGGQMLAPLVARALGSESHGLAFYRFPFDDVDAAKTRFRGGLDVLPIDELARGAIVGEAQLAFTMHEWIFTELE